MKAGLLSSSHATKKVFLHNLFKLSPDPDSDRTTVRAISQYSKICVKQPLSKRQKIHFRDQLSLNAGQKYCRMLQGEHSAILSTFIKLQFVMKIFVLSTFEWPFYTGCTLHDISELITY